MKTFVIGLFSIIYFQYIFSQKNNIEIPYYPNEVVEYSLKYGIFNIGEAHLEFGYNQKCKGAFIQAYVKSSGLMKLINDIHLRYECCMDTVTGLPISDSRILIEGDYVNINTVFYDHYTYENFSLIYSKKTDTLFCPKYIYDILSGFYLYRANFLSDNLPLNHTYSITLFFIDEIWDLKIIYCGAETRNTIYGPIECIKVQPVTIIGHFFRTTNAMSIWFTNNGKYIPVEFSTNFRFGTLHGYIANYKKPLINKK